MNPKLGWSLAILALVAGWLSYRWAGFSLALGVVVFWLLLQFNRSLRVMRIAGGSAVASVPSAVMLHSRLRVGLPMLQIVALSGSIGELIEETPETWRWADPSGAEVHIVCEKGRCVRWSLHRPAEPAA